MYAGLCVSPACVAGGGPRMASKYSPGSRATGCTAAGLRTVQIAAWIAASDAGEVSSCRQQLTTLHLYASLTTRVAVQASDTEGVQAALQSVLNETAARLLRPKSKDLASLQSPLSMVSGIPWLPLNSNIFSGKQNSDHQQPSTVRHSLLAASDAQADVGSLHSWDDALRTTFGAEYFTKLRNKTDMVCAPVQLYTAWPVS